MDREREREREFYQNLTQQHVNVLQLLYYYINQPYDTRRLAGYKYAVRAVLLSCHHQIRSDQIS
jgi:hypothetical protein